MGQTRDGKQLGVAGYGLSVGTFAEQTETIEAHYSELNVARTAVLDYFQSPAQQELSKIFSWENHFQLRPGKHLIQYAALFTCLSIFCTALCILSQCLLSHMLLHAPELCACEGI